MRVSHSFGLNSVIYNPDGIGLNLNLEHLDEPDLHAFISQAEGLRDHVAEGWPNLSHVFDVIAEMGRIWDTPRHIPQQVPTGMVAAHVATDPTAPLDHQVDEYGRAMALIMPLVEDQELSPGLRHAWNETLRELAREVRVRNFERMR